MIERLLHLAAGLVIAGLAGLTGCSRDSGADDSALRSAPVEQAPPFEPYEAPRAAPTPASPRADAGPAAPSQDAAPAPLLRPWWVMVLQTQPRPRAAPRWQSLEASSSGMLHMPDATGWRCLYNPVRTQPLLDESDEVEGWSALRSVRCTTDGWRTFVEGMLHFDVDPLGNVTGPAEQAELYLRDRQGERPVELVILLRADEPRRPRPVWGPAGPHRHQAAGEASKPPPSE